MTLTFVCDQDADLDGKPEVKGSVVNNHLQATVKAKRSCASFSLTYIYQKYAYIFSIVFIAAGVFVTFFGLRLFKPVLFILTTLLITAVLLLLVYQLIMSSHTKQYLFWVVLGVSGLIGLTGAYFVTRYNGVCFVVAGGCLGGVLGFFIYGLAMASWAPPVRRRLEG
jgi:hypothetical protein